MGTKSDLMKGKDVRKTGLFIVVFAASFIYILWRLLFTLPLHHGTAAMIFGVMLWLCECGTAIETFTHFNNARHVDIPEMPEIGAELYPEVDVLVTTHNESVELLYKTLNGCKNMKYPAGFKVHIYLCDDNDRPEMKELASRLQVGYHGFTDNKYAKAGNINYALDRTASPLVAIFDADMIPTSDFLLETVPYFFLPAMIKEDGKWRMRTEKEREKQQPIGYVQTHQSFYNPDVLQRNLYLESKAPNEQDYFYRSVNVARMHSNSAAFAGSNAVFSRKSLEDVGGMAVHSITEDFATGIAILGKKYRSIALDKELAHGLAPEDAHNFIKQRQRWSRGAAQGIMTLKFWCGGLSLRAKWNFLISYSYWWTFFRRFVFIMCPILYGVFGIAIADVTLLELMIVWLPYFLLYNKGLQYMSGKTTSAMWSCLVETIQFPYMIGPIVAGTLKIPQKKFWVTPKDKITTRNSNLRLAIPHFILLFLSGITIGVCAYRVFIENYEGAVIVLFWALYNLNGLIHALIYYRGRTDERQHERIPVQMPVSLYPNGRKMQGVTLDLSEGGLAVLLDLPEYLPYESDFTVKLQYKEYSASLQARVRQVQEMDGKWKYSLMITEIDEYAKQQYFMILYDRAHPFPRKLHIGVTANVKGILKGAFAKRHRGERRLPRIELPVVLTSPQAGQVDVVNFNYRYIMVKNQPDLPERLSVNFTKDLQAVCFLSRELNEARQGPHVLYEISDWEELACSAAFRDYLFGLPVRDYQMQYA